MLKTFTQIARNRLYFHKMNKYNPKMFLSTINEIAPNVELKDLTKTLYTKLQKLDQEYNQLTEKLLKHNTELSAEELAYIRKRTEEINQHHDAFSEYKDYLKTMQDLLNMKKEATGDKETLDFLQDEMKKYEEKLQELDERAIDLLIAPEEYDDRNAAKLEIRAGILIVFPILISISCWWFRICFICRRCLENVSSILYIKRMEVTSTKAHLT